MEDVALFVASVGKCRSTNLGLVTPERNISDSQDVLSLTLFKISLQNQVQGMQWHIFRHRVSSRMSTYLFSLRHGGFLRNLECFMLQLTGMGVCPRVENYEELWCRCSTLASSHTSIVSPGPLSKHPTNVVGHFYPGLPDDTRNSFRMYTGFP